MAEKPRRESTTWSMLNPGAGISCITSGKSAFPSAILPAGFLYELLLALALPGFLPGSGIEISLDQDTSER